MKWIFLSPHLDDAIYSCGGLIWELTYTGHSVEIWTICAGDPPPGPLSPFAQELHERWKTGPEAIARRRTEDLAACARLNATAHHMDVPDCIYRRLPGSLAARVQAEADLFSDLHPLDETLIESLRHKISAKLPAGAMLAGPMGIGAHIDHKLTVEVARRLNISIWHYPDYPYVATHKVALSEWIGKNWRARTIPVSPAGLQAWQAAVADYTSQISTFWRSIDEMRAHLENYLRRGGGATLWQSPPGTTPGQQED